MLLASHSRVVASVGQTTKGHWRTGVCKPFKRRTLRALSSIKIQRRNIHWRDSSPLHRNFWCTPTPSRFSQHLNSSLSISPLPRMKRYATLNFFLHSTRPIIFHQYSFHQSHDDSYQFHKHRSPFIHAFPINSNHWVHFDKLCTIRCTKTCN
jgi:hypothetical protein